MHKIATLASLLPLGLFVTTVTFAQTTSTSIPDASNPNMERFCDPKNNADVLAKINGYESQLKSLGKEQEGERIAILEKINKATRKLKCTYRAIRD